MKTLYFYGLIFGIGLSFSVISSLVLIASFFYEVSHLTGVFVSWLISIFVMSRFRERFAFRSENRKWVKDGIKLRKFYAKEDESVGGKNA